MNLILHSLTESSNHNRKGPLELSGQLTVSHSNFNVPLRDLHLDKNTYSKLKAQGIHHKNKQTTNKQTNL